MEEIVSKSILTKAYKHLEENPLSNIGCTIGLIDENDIYNWKCTLMGPSDSPYKRGFFRIFLKFPKDFPIHGPEVIFDTPIYHLNINPYRNGNNIGDPLGFVPIERLNFWKPEYSIKEVLTYVYGLFYFVDLDCAYGDERKIEYLHDRGTYVEKIKYFVRKYAGTSNFSLDWANNMSWNFQVY